MVMSLTIGPTAARTDVEDVRRTLWLTGCDAEWPLSQTRRLYYCVREGASSLSARLGGAWALFVDEKGGIHASETGAAALSIDRAGLGAIVHACMLVCDRRTSNFQGRGATSAGWTSWSSPTGQDSSQGRNGALARFELLRMDGDETTSVERQYGRMQGLRVSHRRVMLSARAPGGVAGAEPRGAIVPSRSVCCDRGGC